MTKKFEKQLDSSQSFSNFVKKTATTQKVDATLYSDKLL